MKFEAIGCSLDFKDALGYVLESKWHFEVALDMFSCILGELGAPLGYPWAPLGQTWGLFSSLLTTLGRALDPFGNFGAPVTKKVPKLIENGTRNEDIFDDILSLCEKWQTAFGLRLRGRIGVRASCFHPLGVHVCPLFF